MSWLLDTMVISELVRPEPSPRVVEWLGEQREANLYLSVLSLGEIAKGIHRLTTGRRRADLTAWLEHEVVGRFGQRLLPVNSGIARTWGELAGASLQSGRPLPVIDGLLAATARHHQLRMVTRNVDHFAGLGVEIRNPWE